MKGNYGIYRVVNYNNNGYDKILQQGLKEKHLFNLSMVFFND